MKLVVKLKNSKYCDGCPELFGGINEDFTHCWYNEKYKLKVKWYRMYKGKWKNKKRNIFKVIRPQECIKENGL